MSADPWDEFEAEMDAAHVESDSGEDERPPATGFTSRIIGWQGAGPATVVASVSPTEHDKRLREFTEARREAMHATVGKKLLAAGSVLMSAEAKKSDRCRRHVPAGRAPHGAEVVALRSVGEVTGVAFAPPTANERRERQSRWCVTAEGSPHVLCLWAWSFANDAACGKCHSETVPGSTKCRRCKMTINTHAVLQSAYLHRRFYGHVQRVNCVAVSPSSKFLASGGDDNDVRLWRVGSLKMETTPEAQLQSRGKCVRVLRGHTAPVTCVQFSHDGRLLVSTGRDGTARVWDVSRLLGPPAATAAAAAAAAAAASAAAAAAGPAGTASARASPKAVAATTFSAPPSSALVPAAAGARPFRQLHLLTGYLSDVTAVDLAYDGTYIVVGGYDPYVRLYPMFNDSRINAAAFKCQAQIRAHSDWVLACRFWHPQQASLVLPNDALAGREQRYGTVDADGRTEQFVEWVEKEPNVFDRVAAPHGGAAVDSDSDSASSRSDDDQTASSSASDTDGEADRGGGGSGVPGVSRPRETKRERRRRRREGEKRRAAAAAAVAARRAAREAQARGKVRQWPWMCASAGADYAIKVWDVLSQKLLRRMHSGMLPSGKREQQAAVAEAATGAAAAAGSTTAVAAGGEGGTVPEALDALAEAVAAVGTSGDGSGGGDSEDTGAPPQLFRDGHVAQVTSVDFSPDGSLLVSSGGDGRVLLWSVETGERLETLTAVEGRNAINACRFSPDGALIAAGEFGCLRLWRNKGPAEVWTADAKPPPPPSGSTRSLLR